MIHNILIFLAYTLTVAGAALLATAWGKEALIALICLECVLMNLFITKQIMLFGFAATTADALGIGAVLCLNVLQEYWGKETAKKAILLSFGLMLFYVLVSTFHLWYTPALHDTSHAAFALLLTPMPRIMCASLITYIAIQFLEYQLYGFLRKYVSLSFTMRNFSTIALTQLLDTILFSFLGLYGIIEHIGEVIVVSYAIKLITILIMTPIITSTQYLFPRNT